MSTSDHNIHSAATQTRIAGAGTIQRRTTFDVQEDHIPVTTSPTSYSHGSPRVAPLGVPLDHDRDSSPDSARVPRRRANRLSTLSSNITQRLSEHMQPEQEIKPPPPLPQQLKNIATMSWINLLLVFIPVSWACNFALPHTSQNDTLIFIFSFLAIIPLAKMLAFATDELSMRVGETLAGLLNATLGNAVELIVSIIALAQCQLQVVQSSLVGSILSNLLLVLGMCFFAGGVKYAEQGFGMSATQLNSSLLTISVIAVLLPAAFHEVAGQFIPDDIEGPEILSFSRGAAIILLFIYGSYLVFQLFSHKELYDDNATDFKSTRYPNRPSRNSLTSMGPRWLRRFGRNANNSSEPLSSKAMNGGTDVEMTDRSASPERASSLERSEGGNSSTAVHDEAEVISERRGRVADRDLEAQDREAQKGRAKEGEEGEGKKKVENPSLSLWTTIALLAVVTVLVAVTAEWLVDSIDGLTSTGKISKEFVGLILLPIVGNAAEHVTAVTVSVKDKLTLSLGVAVGSSIQIALFVIPFTVVLSWIMAKPLTLLFDPFESIVLFLSVMVVNYTVQDGKSNWLEGMILMCLYVIIAVTFWYYPGVSISQQIITPSLRC